MIEYIIKKIVKDVKSLKGILQIFSQKYLHKKRALKKRVLH